MAIAVAAAVLCHAAGAHAGAARTTAVPPYVNLGTTDAVYELIERQLPGAKAHFSLVLADTCPGSAPPCYSLADGDAGVVTVTATGAAELAAGVGYYLREYCSMSIGWKRGGGSNLFIPATWPKIGMKAVAMKRNTPWSYMMNVCTHSYSLVWYSWSDWEDFLDWMALSGINQFLGMTGQEEVQYKVFQKFGLSDTDIRQWFNGPALLTWSRGQNEYGADIAGPLPRSWMKQQWNMMKNITKRYRSLGMTSQLPAFQGNVPVQLKEVHKDANITKSGATGWMNSVDPLYAKIADEWMKTIIEDFGTDHWYQLDGYFNGGTAPWMQDTVAVSSPADAFARADPVPDATACEWGNLAKNMYSAGCPNSGCKGYKTAAAAKAACVELASCSAITAGKTQTTWQLRRSPKLASSPIHEESYAITNADACGHAPAPPPPPPAPTPPIDLASWEARGLAAYTGLNRTDPDAIWSFQGWAFVGWSTDAQRDSLKSFIDVTPKGKFNVIDMSVNGEGEWKKWSNGTGLWGHADKANFIWTTLHDFGGTDGLKGDLARINQIPFDAFEAKANVWGTGFTPEGIDQNPVYYEFMLDQNFRTEPVADITAHIIARSQRRYNLAAPSKDVADAWSLLVQSAYAQDLSVQDGTGVAHLGAEEGWSFTKQHTPTEPMCQIYNAWDKLIAASATIKAAEPFRYDLVNTGREVLAQLAGPAGHNFTAAIGGAAGSLKADAIKTTGAFYVQVLDDLDTLLATDTAFQLGPWIAMAKGFATENGVEDCTSSDPALWPTITTCAKFYEWNARTQLTTWNPTGLGNSIPGGPIDYASKHWSGLVSDYYAARVTLVIKQALSDAAAGKALNSAAVNTLKSQHAYTWTTSTNAYPTDVVGDFVEVSKAMKAKYQSFFATC